LQNRAATKSMYWWSKNNLKDIHVGVIKRWSKNKLGETLRGDKLYQISYAMLKGLG